MGRPASSTTWDGLWAQLNGMPRASAAAVYGDGPPGIAGGHGRPGVRRQQGRLGRPGPAAAQDVDALAGGDQAGGPVGREAAADLLQAAGHDAASGAGSSAPSQASTRRKPASALERLFAVRPPDQTWRSQASAPRCGQGDEGQADRFVGRPAGWSGDARHRDRDVGPDPCPRADRHRPSRLRRYGPVAGEGRLRHAEQGGLGSVAVAHHAAQEVAARAGDLRQDVADEAARARLGRRQGQPAGQARGLDLARKGDQRLGRRRAAGGHVWLVFCGALPGWKSHVWGMPGPPSVPMATPFIVK